MPIPSRLESLYEEYFDHPPISVEVMRADGSNRELFRIRGNEGFTCVGVHGPDAAENRAFISYSRSLAEAGIRVPKLYVVDEDSHLYLVQDLGDLTLYRALEEARSDGFPDSIRPHYRQVVADLARIQVHGGEAVDFSVAYPCPSFDRRSIRWDLNYFKYLFLRLAHVPFDEDHLEDDFERLTEFLLAEESRHFLYRDFQSRNIMLHAAGDGDLLPWYIDYQGGRRGPLQYDLASLLYDAKADLPPEFRAELMEHYLDVVAEETDVDRDRFRHHFPGFVLVRALQAMGAYGYRGLHEGKPHFIASIPFAVRNVRSLIETDFPIELPELAEVFEWLAEYHSEQWVDPPPEESGIEEAQPGSLPDPDPAAGGVATTSEEPTLAVSITSFSYKKGSYPSDSTEHGGGFVFDCRSLKNPGRNEEYQSLSGLDPDVIEFLEQIEDVEAFWQHVRGISELAVEEYVRRGFEHLSISFGCTGGQHRSVYMAERLARHLAQEYPQVRPVTVHREEESWRGTGE